MIIYILCYNEKTLNDATYIYSYPWAYPILLENQDASFENVFWKQLKQLYPQWKNHNYVGVLSYSAYKKINICKLTENLKYYKTDYVHFVNNNMSVVDPTNHPHLYYSIIMKDVLSKFKLNPGIECMFNYFMCRPSWMMKFIDWYQQMIPILMKHPLIWTDAMYKGNLTKEELIQLWGKPYYPHLPFVLERLNGCFFQTYCSSIAIDNLMI